MAAIVIGALILALGSLNEYVGDGTGDEIFQRLPGYDLICRNPGIAGMIGVLMILLAFVFPSTGARLRDD